MVSLPGASILHSGTQARRANRRPSEAAGEFFGKCPTFSDGLSNTNRRLRESAQGDRLKASCWLAGDYRLVDGLEIGFDLDRIRNQDLWYKFRSIRLITNRAVERFWILIRALLLRLQLGVGPPNSPLPDFRAFDGSAAGLHSRLCNGILNANL